MRKEFTFSRDDSDKSYNTDAKPAAPIYLDKQVSDIIEEVAFKKGVDRSAVVNEFLKKNIRKVETM